MAIVICLQWRRIKRQEKLISDLNEKDFNEVMDYGKVYRRRYKFIIVSNVDGNALNTVADMYHDKGYDIDREKSTDRLLVFVKSEEVKED